MIAFIAKLIGRVSESPAPKLAAVELTLAYIPGKDPGKKEFIKPATLHVKSSLLKPIIKSYHNVLQA